MAFIGDDEIEALDRDRRVVGHQTLRIGPRQFEGRDLFFLFRQFLAGENRVDALDRGDHDLRILVEAGRAEFLDVVDFGKRTSRAGRAVGEIFVARLADEVGAIGEEQDAPEASVGQQPVA